MEKEPMKRLDELRVGQTVKIYQQPFSEEAFEGEAKVLKIDEIYRNGNYYKAMLTVQFPGEKQKVTRNKIYTT